MKRTASPCLSRFHPVYLYVVLSIHTQMHGHNLNIPFSFLARVSVHHHRSATLELALPFLNMAFLFSFPELAHSYQTQWHCVASGKPDEKQYRVVSSCFSGILLSNRQEEHEYSGLLNMGFSPTHSGAVLLP